MGILGSRFAVFAISLSDIRIRPGSTVKMLSRLQRTPLASTMPRSRPILKLMNTSISRPTKVVKALLVMVEKAFTRAFFMACLRSAVQRTSWRYRFIRMME